jgi:hypothetical protein
MELLDRYLQAVRKHLPWQRQDDIVAELRANLEAQLEDKEAALGRPLTQGEAEGWLREIGPPIKVAAPYQPQQYLIGPALFPTYWFALRTVLLWVLAIYSIVNTVQIFAGANPSASAVAEALWRIPGVLMEAAAWVTLVFAVIEFAVTHYPGKFPALANPFLDWSPGDLPPLEKQAPPGGKRRSFAQSVTELVFSFLFLVWLLLLPPHPFLLLGPGALYLDALPYRLAPAWTLFYWCVVALNVFQLVVRVVELWSGSWQVRRPLLQYVEKALGVAPLLVLLLVPGHLFVTLKNPAADLARIGPTLDPINQGIFRIVLLLAVITVLEMAWTIGKRILAANRMQAAAMR